jgi:hypothetical protein
MSNQPLAVTDTAATPAEGPEPAVRFQIAEVEQPLDDFEGSTFDLCGCAGTGPVEQVTFVP